MSTKNKCELCSSELIPHEIEIHTGANRFGTDKEIIVRATQMECANSACSNAFISENESERISSCIEKASRYAASPSDISEMRNALGFRTKSEASEFLCFNSKSFSKWETGKFEANWANEMLLRLSVYSEKNREFIQYLHDNKFKYDPADYELMASFKGITWKFAESTLKGSVGTYPKDKKSLQDFTEMNPQAANKFSADGTYQEAA